MDVCGFEVEEAGCVWDKGDGSMGWWEDDVESLRGLGGREGAGLRSTCEGIGDGEELDCEGERRAEGLEGGRGGRVLFA